MVNAGTCSKVNRKVNGTVNGRVTVHFAFKVNDSINHPPQSPHLDSLR